MLGSASFIIKHSVGLIPMFAKAKSAFKLHCYRLQHPLTYPDSEIRRDHPKCCFHEDLCFVSGEWLAIVVETVTH